jgi:phage shock protein PspC (stress-responsive transcriptional regulator)
MKETIKINLGQRLFDLDKDSYDRLKIYLDSLKRYFQKSPKEADEILQDIEQRIADMLEEKLSDRRQIITIEDIDEVINKMGTIEDFELDDQNSDSESSTESRESEKAADQNVKENRRMFRDIDNNILGGVCSGMAAYFNIDIVWIRLGFVLLVLLKGAGILAYIILWFVIPAARNTAQKLQMHGRPVNVENIEQSVKDEFNKVKDNFSKVSKTESFKRIQSVTAEIFETIGSILLVLLRIILVFAGITFVIVAIFIILVFFAVIPFDHLPHVSFQNIPFWDHISPLTHNLSLFTFAIAIVVIIPIIGILASSIRFIFNVKKRNGILSAFSWTIWSLALVFIIVTIISGEKNLSIEEKIEETTELKVSNNKTLLITISKESFPSTRVGHYNIFGREFLYNFNGEQCYIQPHFIMSTSEDSLVYIEISKTNTFSFSEDREDDFSQKYYWQLNDSILVLNKYFVIENDEIWTLPGMNINIKIPKGNKVKLKGDASKLFEMIESSSDTVTIKEINF